MWYRATTTAIISAIKRANHSSTAFLWKRQQNHRNQVASTMLPLCLAWSACSGLCVFHCFCCRFFRLCRLFRFLTLLLMWLLSLVPFFVYHYCLRLVCAHLTVRRRLFATDPLPTGRGAKTQLYRWRRDGCKQTTTPIDWYILTVMEMDFLEIELFG